MFAKSEQVPKQKQLMEKKASFGGQARKQYKDLNLDIKDTSSLICLSIIGNKYCQGENLHAIVASAIEQFKEVTFLIGDETHWHNLKDATSTEQQIAGLKQQAIQLGSTYLKTNLSAFLAPLKKYISEVQFYERYGHQSTSEQVLTINLLAKENNISFQIVRWHEWVSNNKHSYAAKRMEILELYNTDPMLIDNINKTAHAFVNAHDSVTLNNSRDYLKNESPDIFCTAAALGYDFVAYPGKITDIFAATVKLLISDKNTKDPHPLSIGAEHPYKKANWLRIKVNTKNKKNALDLTYVHQGENRMGFFSKNSRKYHSLSDLSDSTKMSSTEVTSNSTKKPEFLHFYEKKQEALLTSDLDGDDVNYAWDKESKSPPSVDHVFEYIESLSVSEQKIYLKALSRGAEERLRNHTPSPRGY